MIKYANEIKRTHSLLNVLATTGGNLFRLTIFRLRNLLKQTRVFGLKNSNKIMTKFVNYFTKQKMAFVNSYDPNKLEIQYKNLSVIFNFQKNLSDL
jgi:glycine cleavage system pyridoxal-binding protein P